MTEFLFLGGILGCRVLQKISSKSISNDMPNAPQDNAVYLSMKFAMSAFFSAILFLLSGEISSIFSLSPLGYFLAFLTGVTLTGSTVCSLFAMRGSSVVLGALFGMAGLLVPTVAGIFLYNQPISLFQWGGLLLLFVAAWLLASSSEKTNGKIHPKTLLLLFGSMLCNGGTMLLQTLYKFYVPEGSVSLYSFLQFLIPAAVLFVVGLAWTRKEKASIFRPQKKLTLVTFMAAFALFGISQISTMASATVPVAVLFPVSDGGGMVIAAVVAAIIFKEKLTVKSTLGVLIGILAVCIMKLLG